MRTSLFFVSNYPDAFINTSWMNHMLDPGSQCYLLLTSQNKKREHMLRHKSNGTIDCKIVIGPPNMVTFMASREIFTPCIYEIVMSHLSVTLYVTPDCCTILLMAYYRSISE